MLPIFKDYRRMLFDNGLDLSEYFVLYHLTDT